MSEQPKQSDEARLGTETVFDDDARIDLHRNQYVPKFDREAIDRVHAAYDQPLEKEVPLTREAIALRQLTTLNRVRLATMRNEDKLDHWNDDMGLAA